MKPYIELQADEFDADAVTLFWSQIVGRGFKKISLNLDTETGAFAATASGWQADLSLLEMGGRLKSWKLATKWERLANSEIEDEEYERQVTQEARAALNYLLDACPDSVRLEKACIDGDSCE